ncbi:carbon-nitrogen hydrolase family protein [Devosia geojensis]|nr:carbon-nitrogen hydrolase family protein [Devosia geojensis]
MKIAALQMRSGIEPEANMDALEALAEEAAGQGARYLLSPEVTVVFAESREQLASIAGPYEGNPHLERAAGIARRHGVHLHVGSLAVALPDGRFANRSVLFSPDGRVEATYDKIHLFDATLAGLRDYRESATYRGGERAVTAPVGDFTLGLAICYDMRFPRLFNTLAKSGAQVMAVPAAFTVPTGEAHWHVLLRARAIETGSYVIAAAQGGHHANGRATYGHSLIVNPWGRIVAEVEGDAPGVIVAEVELEKVADARARIPVLANERDFAPDPVLPVGVI